MKRQFNPTVTLQTQPGADALPSCILTDFDSGASNCNRILLSGRAEQFTYVTGALCVMLDVHSGMFTAELREVHLGAH